MEPKLTEKDQRDLEEIFRIREKELNGLEYECGSVLERTLLIIASDVHTLVNAYLVDNGYFSRRL